MDRCRMLALRGILHRRVVSVASEAIAEVEGWVGPAALVATDPSRHFAPPIVAGRKNYSITTPAMANSSISGFGQI
jgi:hypothetical protein